MTQHLDLDELVRAAGTALTGHRIAEARGLLDQALQPTLRSGASPVRLASLGVNAAALAQTTGDFSSAERYGRQMVELGEADPLVGFNLSWYRLRQNVLRDRLEAALPAAQRLVAASLAPQIDPLQRVEVIAELAGLQAANGRPAEAIALYQQACEGLHRCGSHQQWLAEALFEQARLLMSVVRACSEHALGDLTPYPQPAVAAAADHRRRALAALSQASACLHVDDRSSPLAESIEAFQRVVVEQPRGADEHALAAFTALVARHRTQRMCDLAAWSACELSRLHLQRGDADSALATLRSARQRLPLQGFAPARAQIDYHESLALRQRGDHRQALFGYQRYSQAPCERRLMAPAGLHDGSLIDAATRLAGATRRSHFLSQSGRFEPRPAAPFAPPRALPAHPAGRAASLTARETEVLGLLCQGQRNSQLADRLGISPNTVRNHVAVIFRKLGVSTREQAVSLALAPASTAAGSALDDPAAATPSAAALHDTTP